MNEESRYSVDRRSEEDKEFFDKYSPTGESEWSRTSTVPFDEEDVLIERHYSLGSMDHGGIIDHRGKGPRGYKRSDERIRDDVSDALYRCYEVDASEIGVSVKEGVVTLQGTVDSRIAKKVAEMTVDTCLGVRDVLNELRIRPPQSQSGQGLVRGTGWS